MYLLKEAEFYPVLYILFYFIYVFGIFMINRGEIFGSVFADLSLLLSGIHHRNALIITYLHATNTR